MISEVASFKEEVLMTPELVEGEEDIFKNCPSFIQETRVRMTQLLTHSVAHSTRPSFRPKINNQSIKKFCGQLSKSWQKLGVFLEKRFKN